MRSDFSLNNVPFILDYYPFILAIALLSYIITINIISYLIMYFYIVFGWFFKKNLNASKPSEHPPQVEECLLGGNIGCRDKTSSWYLKGSPM